MEASRHTVHVVVFLVNILRRLGNIRELQVDRLLINMSA